MVQCVYFSPFSGASSPDSPSPRPTTGALSLDPAYWVIVSLGHRSCILGYRSFFLWVTGSCILGHVSVFTWDTGSSVIRSQDLQVMYLATHQLVIIQWVKTTLFTEYTGEIFRQSLGRPQVNIYPLHRW